MNKIYSNDKIQNVLNSGQKKYSKLKQYGLTHKKISATVIIVLIIILYFLYKIIFPAGTITTYAIGEVQKGSVVTYITGSGQVSASNQIELKAKASGDILKVNVTTGQEVKAGQVIAQIDNPSAYINYRSAQIAYEKLLNSDETTKIQAENNLVDAKKNLSKSGDNLNNAYDTGFNSTANTYVDLSEVVNGINDMLYSAGGFLVDSNMYSLSPQSKTYKQNAGVNFDKAKENYRNNLQTYRGLSRLSATSSLDQLFKSTYATTKEISDVLKDLKNTVDYIKNQDTNNRDTNSSSINTASNNLTSWLNKINSDLSNLSNTINNINDLSETARNAPQVLAQQEASYRQTISGGSLDIESQALNLEQKRLDYQNIFITAPFDGVIAKMSVKKSDSISSGSIIGTIITKDKVADITVNEVDAAKIVPGQKATLTFDAISDLSISGVVQSIDLVGTVTQGVVNYNVKITFDVQDERVKSGMSVGASIITNNKQDILIVPNSSIKTKGGVKYVELFNVNTATSSTPQEINEVPIQQAVEVGLSGDTSTEILSGLILGDKIAIKTVTTSASAAKTSTAPSLLGAGGAGGTRSGATGSSATRALGR